MVMEERTAPPSRQPPRRQDSVQDLLYNRQDAGAPAPPAKGRGRGTGQNALPANAAPFAEGENLQPAYPQDYHRKKGQQQLATGKVGGDTQFACGFDPAVYAANAATNQAMRATRHAQNSGSGNILAHD